MVPSWTWLTRDETEGAGTRVIRPHASTELHVHLDPPPPGTGSPRLRSNPHRALNMAAASASSAFAASCIASSAAAVSPSGAVGKSLGFSYSLAASVNLVSASIGRASQNASSSAVVDKSSPGPHNRRAVGGAPGQRKAVVVALGRRTACARGLLRILDGVLGNVATPRGGPVDIGAGRRRDGLADFSSAHALSGNLGDANDLGDVCVVDWPGVVGGAVSASSPCGGVDMVVKRVKTQELYVVNVEMGDKEDVCALQFARRRG